MLVFIENDYYCVEFELFYVEFMYSYWYLNFILYYNLVIICCKRYCVYIKLLR